MDYSSEAVRDREWKYVVHIRDHFSKYSTAYPLRSKESAEVADRFGDWISSYGPPSICQCDNGTEFQGALLLVAQRYGVHIINS